MEIYNRIKADLILFLVIYVIVGWIFNALPFGRDTTDGNKRSDISLHVDAMTGCEYLGGKRGGLTPRLDINGNHICLGDLR